MYLEVLNVSPQLKIKARSSSGKHGLQEVFGIQEECELGNTLKLLALTGDTTWGGSWLRVMYIFMK